jgi:hypothetical protein
MTISLELEYAILSLDSYNRGYNPGVSGLSDVPGTPVGNWTILDTDLPAGSEVANFYASAYLSGGTVVISYRGTDDPLGDSVAWTGGGGFQTRQAELAAQFYYQVKQEYPGANIVLTGHSLGGGLAGLVSMVTGSPAYIYDNMPFELSAENTLAFAKRSHAELVQIATISAPGGGVPVFSLNEYNRLMAERQI